MSDNDMEVIDIKPDPDESPYIPDTTPSLQIQDVRSLTDSDGKTQSSLLRTQPSTLKPHTNRTNQTFNPLNRTGEKSTFLKRLGTSNKSLYEEYLRFKIKNLQPNISKDKRIIITPTKFKDGKVKTVKPLYKEGTILPVIINPQDEEADFMDWHLNIHNQKQQEHGKRIKLNDPLSGSSVKPQLSVINDATKKGCAPSLVSIQTKAECSLGKPPRIGINLATPQTSNSNPINTVTLPPPTIVTLRTQPTKCYGKTTSPTILTSASTQSKTPSLTQLNTSSSTATMPKPHVEGLPNNFNPVVKLTRINDIVPDISNPTSIPTTSPIFVTAYSKPPILLNAMATTIPSSSTASNPHPSTSSAPTANKLIERVDNAIKNNIQILMGKNEVHNANNSTERANILVKNKSNIIMRKTQSHIVKNLRENLVKNNQISTRKPQNESSLQLKSAPKASISIPPPQLPNNLIGPDKNNMSQYIKQIQQTISAIQKITKTPEIKTTSLPELPRDKNHTRIAHVVEKVPPVPVKTFRDKATMAKDRGVIRSFQSRLSRLKRKNDLLKAKVKVLQSQVNQKQKPLYEQADRLEKLKEEGNTQAIFLLEQIQNFDKKSVIYSMESMTIFTVLHKRSQKGYNFLQHYNILGMPNRTTIRRFIEKDGNFQDRTIDEHLDD